MTWRVRSASTCRPLPPNRGRGRLGWATPLPWSPGRAVAGSANARGLGRVAAAPGTAWAGPLPAWPNPWAAWPDPWAAWPDPWAAWPDPWAAWPDPGPAMPPEVAVAELLVAGVVVATPAAAPV